MRQLRKGRPARPRLTEEQVIEIRKRYQAGETQALIAWEYVISITHCNGIIHGRSWKHLPLFPRG